MISRTMDAAAFNEIATHPEVRPWLGYADPLEPIDMTPHIVNPNNFAFLTKQGDGGYVLLKLHPGLYVAHTMALPSARGKPMLRLMRDGFAQMFLATDAVEIVSQVPDGNVAAQGWSQLAGFRPTFRRENFFPLMGEVVGCQFLSLTFSDWAIKDRECKQRGEIFHSHIAEVAGETSHPHDYVHDCMVGAAYGCCIENNAAKGIGMYNRYAPLAGYAQTSLISINPCTVDTGNAIIQIESGKMSVLKVY